MWQRIKTLRASDWLVVLQSAVLLPVLKIRLRRAKLEQVHDALARRSPFSGGERPGDVDRARRVAWAVSGVADRLPIEVTCLHRSLTLWFLLRRRAIPSILRFGVKPGAPPAFHAWVEIGGEVINDRPDVASRYLPFNKPIEPSEVARFD